MFLGGQWEGSLKSLEAGHPSYSFNGGGMGGSKMSHTYQSEAPGR